MMAGLFSATILPHTGPGVNNGSALPTGHLLDRRPTRLRICRFPRKRHTLGT